MGKHKSKKSKKERKHSKDHSRDHGGTATEQMPLEASGAANYTPETANLIRIGNAENQLELDESQWHRLDDKIDDKELARLRKQAARRKADSEAEDYDEKKEKRKAVEKAKLKKKQAEDRILKKRRAELAEIEGVRQSGADGPQAATAAGDAEAEKRKKKKKSRRKGRDGEEQSDQGMKTDMVQPYAADEASNLTRDQNRAVQHEIMSALQDEGRNFEVTAIPESKVKEEGKSGNATTTQAPPI